MLYEGLCMIKSLEKHLSSCHCNLKIKTTEKIYMWFSINISLACNTSKCNNIYKSIKSLTVGLPTFYGIGVGPSPSVFDILYVQWVQLF